MKKTKRLAIITLITVLVLNLSMVVFAEGENGPVDGGTVRPDVIVVPGETE